MPTRPPTHRPPFRVRSRHSDDAYDRTRRATDAQLAEAKRIRSSEAWNQCRAAYLAGHPLCEDPHGHHAMEGRIEAGTQVHHRQQLAKRPDLAFVESNLMSVCEGCHAILSAAERHPHRT